MASSVFNSDVTPAQKTAQSRNVVILTTGGTIASTESGEGSVANKTADDVLTGLDIGGVHVRGRDVFQLGSYLLTHREMRIIAEAVAEEAARDDVDGIVVTHGTDTMEETAFLLDLVHASDKPVVVTGAQKAADQPDTDGPSNLADAVRVAASDIARCKGALIVFAGLIHSPRRLRKDHTIAPDPFRNSDCGPLGRIVGQNPQFTVAPIRPAPLPLPTSTFDTTRVDVVASYPGADAALAEAAVAAGASAVVVAGTGSGNGNHHLCAWAKQAVAAGVTVAVSTRVAQGPVIGIYGNGGAVDLFAAGAVNLGSLPLYHGRLLLGLLRAAGIPATAQTIAQYG